MDYLIISNGGSPKTAVPISSVLTITAVSDSLTEIELVSGAVLKARYEPYVEALRPADGLEFWALHVQKSKDCEPVWTRHPVLGYIERRYLPTDAVEIVDVRMAGDIFDHNDSRAPAVIVDRKRRIATPRPLGEGFMWTDNIVGLLTDLAASAGVADSLPPWLEEIQPSERQTARLKAAESC